MEILYRLAPPNLDTALDSKNVDWVDLFTQLLLRTNGNGEQALEWLRRLAEEHDLLDRNLSFEDILDRLEEKGIIKRDRGNFEVTPQGEQAVRDSVYDRVFQGLSRSFKGQHSTGRTGRGGDRLPETREFRPGDDLGDLDYRNSLRNMLSRAATDEGSTGQEGTENKEAIEILRHSLREEDFEVQEREELSACSTVLMIDISHSMILYGEDRITPAKMVAISLAEYIRRHYPRDTLDVLTFGDEAQEIAVKDLAKVAVGPYHTNTCDGLRLARNLLRRRRNTNKQILMVTDGKPSAVFDRGRLYRNSFGLDPLVLEKTYGEARLCRKEKIRVTTFMIAQDAYLIEFVENFTRICNGQAFYTGLGQLGEFIFVDYAQNRRGKAR